MSNYSASKYYSINTSPVTKKLPLAHKKCQSFKPETLAR